MKRTCKLAAAALLTAAVTVGTVTACAAAETAVTTETYAYLPDHSVYFYDVDDGYSWAFREVDTLAVAGVIQGRGDHLFYPRNAITRADFIVMLDRAYGMSSALESGAVTAQQDFSDVPSDKYYAKSVAAARALGVATGTADNRFLPQQTMSRQDAMVFLKRTIDRTELTLRDGAITGFSDAAEVKSYAQEAVGALTSAKVIGGTNGKLNPNAELLYWDPWDGHFLQNRFRLDFLLFPEPVSGVHKELAVQQIFLLVAFAELFQRNTDLRDAVVQYAVRSDVVFCKIGAPFVESRGHLLRNLIFF